MEESLLLPPGKFQQSWASVSGGERQRLIIGCALIVVKLQHGLQLDGHVPVVLVLDEPTSNCDERAVLAVEKAVISSGVSVIFTTHSEDQAVRLAQKRLVLRSSSVISY